MRKQVQVTNKSDVTDFASLKELMSVFVFFFLKAVITDAK